MSTFEQIPEQPEHIPGRPIAWVLAATVLAIAICGVVVRALRMFDLDGGGESTAAMPGLVPPTQPFSEPLPSEQARTSARTDLDEWQWVDRATHRVRVPVDIAIDRYLEQRGGR